MRLLLERHEEGTQLEQQNASDIAWQSWNAAEVGSWLSSQGFDAQSKLFVEHNIQGDELADLVGSKARVFVN